MYIPVKNIERVIESVIESSAYSRRIKFSDLSDRD